MIKNISLPKWPALIVVGKKVTEDQAKEIIIRTNGFHFCTNDRGFESELYNIINVKEKTENNYKHWDYDDIQKAEEHYGVLPLEYLHNSRIVSSYIGGPHGWCDWSGNIFCNSYNIGKWPSVEEVSKEWEEIAKAFPFLEFKSQLLSGEDVEENTFPLIEFSIKKGKVKVKEEPKEVLVPPVVDLNSAVLRLLVRGGERGCTIEQFKEALEFVGKKLKNKEIKNEEK